MGEEGEVVVGFSHHETVDVAALVLQHCQILALLSDSHLELL